MGWSSGALAVVVVATATPAPAPQGPPSLRYDPPPGFSRSAIAPPEDYTANEFAASVQIYPFRAAGSDPGGVFRATMMRDEIDPRYQETNLIGQPEFRQGTVAGAELVLTIRFAENIAGVPKQRMRMLIVAGGAAALVDAQASSPTTWQRALPALNAMSGSMRVVAGSAPPSVSEGSGAAGRARGIAGLYRGTKPKYVVNLNRPAGYGSHAVAQHFYLFSADGRVYRAYDSIAVPGGDPNKFDFAAAERTDAVNSGRYTIKGKQLTIQMSGQPPETITTAAPRDKRVTINTVVYVKQ